MDSDPKILEGEAYSFLYQEKFDDAFRLFKKSAEIYKSQHNHKQAALCFASAASCWSIKSGEKTFFNSASAYQGAAREAEISRDFEYAALLYKYAAINYERDGELLDFSDCFYRSKECYRKFLYYLLINPKRINPIVKSSEKKGVTGFARHIFLWLAFTFSCFIWGYGERPSRTFFTGIFVVFVAAVFYMSCFLVRGIGMEVFSPNFFEALYFSVVTFTTVGYGDITPMGVSRIVVMFEALSGMLIMPLFMVGLSRKYLRV
ncbi:MAG: ion channel [Candidatus Omnitrophica bacterium]|nr:ion channel [Candidatus Omnitrophota bacterium]